MAKMNLFLIFSVFILEIIGSSSVTDSQGGGKGDLFIEKQTIEVLAIADYSTYALFFELANNRPQRAMADLRLFFAHVFHKMDKAFQNIDINKYKYEIKIIDLIVLETPEDSDFTESSDVTTASENKKHLKSVSNDLVLPYMEELVNGKNFDAALAFTMYSSSDGSAGVAYHGTSCTPNAVGLVHLKNIDVTAKVAAHEVGHILGANHDGEENICHGNEHHNLMTRKGQSNMTFSKCSIGYFARRVSHLKKIGKNCLEKTSKHLDFAKELQQMPGTRFGIDDQCVFSHGKGFRHERIKDLSRICKNLWCHADDATDVLAFGGALDGTKCGRRQRCVDGKCVRKWMSGPRL